MDREPVFPISVKFEDGEIEVYQSVAALETDLEVFDSELATDCEVKDALGRRVRLKISNRLELEELTLLEPPSNK